MIYTVTLNPSIDYIVDVKDFSVNKLNRTTKELMYPGGKGINVSLVLNELGIDSVNLGFTAGFTGEKIIELLNDKNIKSNFIKCAKGNSRVNVKVRSNGETEINGIGPTISKEELDEFFKKLDDLKDDDILVLSGTANSSLPETIYADIMKYVADKKITVVIDTNKEFLRNVLAYKPFLIKPNKHELEEIFNIELDSIEEITCCAKLLQEKGARNVLVSLGENGALLVSEDGNIYNSLPPRGKLVNSIGAGDAMVAGFISKYLETKSYEKAFYYSLCAGSASAYREDFDIKDVVDILLKGLIKTNV